MPKLTIELPSALNLRLKAITDSDKVKTQEFILESIAEKIALLTEREEVCAIADGRFEEFLKDGQSVPWAEVNTYLERRAAGEMIPPPMPKKFIP
ncbi:MAG: CopG family transcriptional regulator [Pseudomonadota bacterium]